MKILLVEDEAQSRGGLQRWLERRGHKVVAVASAEEAEARLTPEAFAFLILDWMLPGKSGVELCREVRARDRGDEIFILLVTARAETEDLQVALDAGANDYLTKPLDLPLLGIRLSVAERQIRDLAERNQARAALEDSAHRLADILENITDGFFAADGDWNLTYLNSSAKKFLGREDDQMLGANLWKEFPEHADSVFATNFRRVLVEKIPLSFEAGGIHGRAWFEVRAYPSGNGISVFFRDITERKQCESERLTTSKLESLGTLAGGIAHDLNNILTVISGNIGLAQLAAPGDCGSLLSFLSKANQAAQQAAHLSGQLLTFSKGGAPLKKRASIEQLLVHATEFPLHGSNLRTEIDLPQDLWRADVDAGQIEQVVNALVLNAREEMPQGGTIQVTARNVEPEEKHGLPLPRGRYLKISVVDRGSGVAEEAFTRIFDPYFTTKLAASGLGLSISYSIVKKHGGLLHLERTSSEGSTFSFYLPAGNGEEEKRARKGERDRQRILVMDDEAAIRDLTSQLLKTLDYEAIAVHDGLEAIRTYEHALRSGENFRAVILDATVRGGLGGVATIERLRRIDPEVKAIICSGYSDEAALSEFLAYGFNDALPKPFTRAELADALKRTMQRTPL